MKKTVQLTEQSLKAVRELAEQLGDGDNGESQTSLQLVLEHTSHMFEGLVEGNIEKVEQAIDELGQIKNQDLYQEVGQLTRQLHDSLRGLKEIIDPHLKDVAERDMPEAADRLEYVMEMTNNAAHKTLSIVEGQFDEYDKLSARAAALLEQIDGLRRYKRRPRKKVDKLVEEAEALTQFLDGFSTTSQNDLTNIMMAQDFQDLTGQVLKKVVSLIRTLEVDLATLIQRFGSKAVIGGEAEDNGHVPTESVMEGGPKKDQVNQDDVDSLLADLGF